VAFKRNSTITATVSAGALMPFTNATSASADASTLSFDASVPVGADPNGSPIILSTNAFNITGDTPTSEILASYAANGIMIDPYNSDGFADPGQGFDGRMGNLGGRSATYTAALNVAPSLAGNGSIAVSAGWEGTIVKAVRNPSPANGYTYVQQYDVYTVLAAAPLAGAFRPPVSATSKAILAYESDFDATVLRSLTMPASCPTLAAASAEIPLNFPWYGWGQERFRGWHAFVTPTDSGYSAYIAGYMANWWDAMHSSAESAADKKAAALKAICHGYDVYGLYLRGHTMGVGAGQWHGHLSQMAIAGFLTGNQDLIDAAFSGNMMGNMVGALEWVAAAQVGDDVDYPSPSGVGSRYDDTYFPQNVGMPAYKAAGTGSGIFRRYVATSLWGIHTEVFSVALMQNGPTGQTGFEAMARGGVYGPTNEYAKSLAYVDRSHTWIPFQYGETGIPTSSIDKYNDWRGTLETDGWTRWTGVPDTPDQTWVGNTPEDTSHRFTASATAGEVDWDYTGWEFNTEGSPTYDIRYSLDPNNVQFVEVTDVAISGTQAGLMSGVQHLFGWRQVTASGAAVWTPNHPIDSDTRTGLRNIATPAGTPTLAVPSYSGQPVPSLHYSPYPAWGAPWFEPINTGVDLDVDVVTIAAGVGYPSGYGSSGITFSYRWFLDGVPQAETSYLFTRVAADAGKVLTAGVTATNSQGSSAEYITAGATIPALTTIPAGTIIDTTFEGRHIIDYEGMTFTDTGGYLPFHLPTKQFKENPSVGMGAMLFENEGSTPNTNAQFTRAFEVASYRIQATIVANHRRDGDTTYSWTHDQLLRIRNAANNVTYLSVDLSKGDETTESVITIDETFAVTVAEQGKLTFSQPTNSVGGIGGPIFMTSLTITKV